MDWGGTLDGKYIGNEMVEYKFEYLLCWVVVRSIDKSKRWEKWKRYGMVWVGGKIRVG